MGAAVQLTTSGNKAETKCQLTTLRNTVEHFQRSPTQGFNFIKIDMKSMRVVVLFDASSALAPGLQWYIGCVVLMADGQQRAIVVHFGSIRCHRVSWSGMAAEVHEFIHAVDIGMLVRDVLKKVKMRNIDRKAFVESRTLLNKIKKKSNNAE